MSQFSRQESSTTVPGASPGGSPELDLPLRAALAARLSDHLAMTKPGITIMVVITAFVGFVMAARGLAWEPITLLATLAGTGLSCMGASVFNQVYERDTDARMQRTSTRPLPAGRLSMGEAMVAGVLCSVLGLALLGFGANWLAAGLSAFTIFSYCLIYTPMKRRSSASTIVGAVPGAMPPLIGAAAASGTVGMDAILLFAIIFAWQLPHFWAIGLLYRDQYAAADLPILPVIDRTGRRTRRQIVLWCAALLVFGALPTVLGVSGYFALAVALLGGAGFLALALRLMWNPGRKQARALFLASLAYLPVVLPLLVLDRG